MFKDFGTREFLAIVGVCGFVAAVFVACIMYGMDPTQPMKEITLIIIGFYFGNKATMDTASGTDPGQGYTCPLGLTAAPTGSAIDSVLTNYETPTAAADPGGV